MYDADVRVLVCGMWRRVEDVGCSTLLLSHFILLAQGRSPNLDRQPARSCLFLFQHWGYSAHAAMPGFLCGFEEFVSQSSRLYCSLSCLLSQLPAALSGFLSPYQVNTFSQNTPVTGEDQVTWPEVTGFSSFPPNWWGNWTSREVKSPEASTLGNRGDMSPEWM